MMSAFIFTDTDYLSAYLLIWLMPAWQKQGGGGLRFFMTLGGARSTSPVSHYILIQ